jgi:spore maturation protein SpmB
MSDSLAWTGLLALGAVHGLNPAMGWLFAVAIGLQERDRRAVWRALGPLALGHALAVGVVVLLAAALGVVLPVQWLKWLIAATLIGCGIFHLRRHRHPRFGGMRMSGRDLTIWSFLVASAHGAGLMALPLVVNTNPHAGHVLAAGMSGASALGVGATLMHTLGYLAMTALLAVIVYEKLGLRILRRAWINLNLIWAIVLIVTGLLTPLL